MSEEAAAEDRPVSNATQGKWRHWEAVHHEKKSDF